MKVAAIYCEICKCFIFSRSRHDMRWCPGQHMAVDGGRDYVKISFNENAPEIKQIDILQTPEELFNDWNVMNNRFGIIFDK